MTSLGPNTKIPIKILNKKNKKGIWCFHEVTKDKTCFLNLVTFLSNVIIQKI